MTKPIEGRSAKLSNAQQASRNGQHAKSNNTEKPALAQELAPMFMPFPIEAMPEPARGFIKEAAEALDCDPSYVALPALSAMAAAIGNSRVIQLKVNWLEPAVVWTCIVGESGQSKSPAIEMVFRPLWAWESRARKKHNQAMADYQNALLEYDAAKRQWKSDGGDESGKPSPKEPVEPKCPRLLTSDTTVEQLAVLLSENWRGLVMMRDELAGWFKGFDQYKGGKGSDAQQWLQMHGARGLKIDRKTGEQRHIDVPRAAVSVAGGVQPGILRQVLAREHLEDGMAARFLFSYPPARAIRWTDKYLSKATEAEWMALFGALVELEPDTDEHDEPKPGIIPLTPSGQGSLIEFYNLTGERQAELTGDLASAWSKLRGYAARLALIVHLVRVAAGDETLESDDAIDAASVASAVALVRWFGNEATRLYAMFEESDEDREERKLVEWVRQRGGEVTERDVQQKYRPLKKPGAAKAALEKLVKVGQGQWRIIQPTAQGGRPGRVFVLPTVSTVYETSANTEKNGSCVDVGAVDTPEAQAPDGRGKLTI